MLSPFNINTLTGKGLLISVPGWRFGQRLYWSSRFKIILCFFGLWQRLQFSLQFCMETRVKDVFLSSGLQCGHPFCIKIVDKSALIYFLPSIALSSPFSIWTISLVTILLSFISRRGCLICYLLDLVSCNEAIGLPQPFGLLSREWLLSAWSACPFSSVAFSYLTFRCL